MRFAMLGCARSSELAAQVDDISLRFARNEEDCARACAVSERIVTYIERSRRETRSIRRAGVPAVSWSVGDGMGRRVTEVAPVRRIWIAEPQCRDLEHVSFNAALLTGVLAGYGDASLLFVGDPAHVRHVRALLHGHGVEGLNRVEWREQSIVDRQSTGWPRLVREYPQLEETLDDAQNWRADLVIMASVTNTGILALKWLCRDWPRATPVLPILHGMVNRIVGPWPRKPWNWPLNLRVLLRLPQPASLWYVLLGDSLLRELEVVHPRLVRHFVTIHLPHIAPARAAVATTGARPSPLRFGHLGVGNLTKGFGIFARIASECAPVAADVQFVLVGYLSTFRDATDFSNVTDVSEHPVPVDVYEAKASSLTYAVNCSNPADYRFAGSSSFLEALFYGKPGIYLRNPYIAGCFDAMGDIGYLCDTPEEMIETIGEIIRAFPLERYRRQVENILAGRKMYEPQSVGARLRQVVEGCRRDP
ncbi:MAG: hypothetical protein ACYC3F_13990 [Gemmatimonadaceae bacterium]